MGGLRIVALIAFAFGTFVGGWAIVSYNSVEFTEASMREGVMWTGIGLASLGLGGILNTLAARRG